ncbi:MAG: hypothetical protein Q9221_006614 [Calogaya cf. arnoldii]
MFKFFSTLFSLFVLLPIAFSTPIDSPTADLTTHQNTIRAGGGGYPGTDPKRKCYSSYFPWRYIITRNCIAALHKLPAASPTRGNFHEGGHYDTFKLPQYARSGDCLVSVELEDRKKDEKSNWQDIQGKASDLIFGCVNDRSKWWAGPTLGGKTLLGDNDGILVKVKKTTPPKVKALY